MALFDGTTGKRFKNSVIIVDSSGVITGILSLNGKVADNLVTGPSSATDHAICRFDAETGKIIQNSSISIADVAGSEIIVLALSNNDLSIRGATGSGVAGSILELLGGEGQGGGDGGAVQIRGGAGTNAGDVQISVSDANAQISVSGALLLTNGTVSCEDLMDIQAGTTITGDIQQGARPITNEIMDPIGLYADNITTETAGTSQRVDWLYVGRISKAITSCMVAVRVTTAYVSAGITPYAEIGIATGDFLGGGSSPALTVRGTTDVAAIYDSTGLKTTTVTLTGITAGDDLWVGYGSKATTTRFKLRACLVDDILSGVMGGRGSQKPSTWSDGVTSIPSATIVPAWIRVVI